MKGQGAFHSGTGGIGIFVEVNFGDAVVVQADGLANGILGDFEAAIQISPEGRFKIKSDGQCDRMASQAFKEFRPVGRLVEDGREMFPDRDFVVAAY